MNAIAFDQVKPKKLDQVVDGERYRTDLGRLLAADETKKLFLFRALNSNYFLQDDKQETIEVLSDVKAEELYRTLPMKFERSLAAAFPSRYGGVGLDTATRYDDYA